MADLRKIRADVGAFSVAVGTPLAGWQSEALALERRTTVIVAPRQSGKSRALSVLALWWAFRRRGQRVLIVSAGEDAARRLLAEAARTATSSRLLAGSVLDENAGLIVLSNGSEIRSVPASERAVRGWTVDLLLVDEAAQVEDDLLLGAAVPTTAARPDARIVLAGSPGDTVGVFYDSARRGRAGSENVATFTWRLEQADWIGADVVAAARESLPPAAFEREFLGRFSEAGAEQAVIPRGWVDAAQARSLEAAGEGAYGLDVARLGSDSTVCALARSGVVRVVWSVHGADLMAVCGRMAATLEDAPAAVWVDATGLGAGVFDRLRELGHPAVAWIAAGRAPNPGRFVNVKAASWWHAREQFRLGLVDLDPADGVLAAQLAGARYSLTSSGAIQIVSKRDMSGPSPDRADAAVIALWATRAGGSARLVVPVGRVLPVARLAARGGAGVSGLPAWQARILREQRRR